MSDLVDKLEEWAWRDPDPNGRARRMHEILNEVEDWTYPPKPTPERLDPPLAVGMAYWLGANRE